MTRNLDAAQLAQPAAVVADGPMMRWQVPGLGGVGVVELGVNVGEALVLVGANGTGRSALSYYLSTTREESTARTVRIFAHRRIWLQSSSIEMTPDQRSQSESNFASWDSQASSRTKLTADEQRSQRVLFDLLARTHVRNDQAAQRYDRGHHATEDDGVEEHVLQRVDRIFRAANLPLTFTGSDTTGFSAHHASGAVYAISEMSDGEKGAFLLAAEVLLAPLGSVVLIDEPERHLHRAISADLLVALMSERSDCGFVLLTHDLDLVGRLDPATTTVCTVGGVTWSGSAANGWELRVEPGRLDVPDAVRNAILGGRTQLLFVEGEVSSLDYPLYRLVFSDRTIVACGGSEEVQRAVAGLDGAASYHWVDGRGVLDGDARTPDAISAMADKRILVLPVNEVENLYYLSWLVDAVAAHQAATLSEDPIAMAAAARTNALESLTQPNIEHLSSENASKILRQQVMAALPKPAELVTAGPAFTVDLTSEFESQRNDLQKCIADGDYDRVIERYSIRSSGFVGTVAKALRFQNHGDYEKTVRTLLANNPDLIGKLRTTVGELP